MRIVVVGGGPAGLMAAEVLRAGGAEVDLYEQMGSVGRKFLVAGKGGLNLTHADAFDVFVGRYGGRAERVAPWLRRFDADALRRWAGALGVDTFVGSSGRVFPLDLKAAPLLRRWVSRLRSDGVRFHVQHAWRGWNRCGALRFDHQGVAVDVGADAVVLALGGGSWPKLGSDGRWAGVLGERGVAIAPLVPSNCGFDVGWSAHFAVRHGGAPVKAVALEWRDRTGRAVRRQGEFVIAAYGVEGSLIYAASADLRDAIAAEGAVTVRLDLAPGRDAARLAAELGRPRGRRSVGEHLRRRAGIDGAKAGLLHEVLDRRQFDDAAALAAAIKALPLTLQAPRPLAEAISSGGGVRFEAMDEALMLRDVAGVFVAGEMVDWEAPTGGYLLTAAFASGCVAADGALRWAGGAAH